MSRARQPASWVRALAWTVAVALCGPASCSPAMILEDTASACRNRYDDDGDGLLDCADPDCAGTSVCELSAATCSDGADNDGDGQTDCQQDACRAAGFCDATVTSCSVSPQTGCRAGQACYATRTPGVEAITFRCRLAGAGALGDSCDADAIDAMTAQDAHPCASGLGCSVLGSPHGACAPYCFADEECPAGAVCNGSPMAPDHPGICTVPCNPVSGLGCFGGGTACRSFHEVGNRAFAQGGARFGCFATELRAGDARPGAACDDPPTGASLPSRVCGFGSVCASQSGASACHASCDVNNPACPGGRACVPLYPGARPSAYGAIVLGYCQ